MTLDEVAFQLLEDYLTAKSMHNYNGNSILSANSF